MSSIVGTSRGAIEGQPSADGLDGSDAQASARTPQVGPRPQRVAARQPRPRRPGERRGREQCVHENEGDGRGKEEGPAKRPRRGQEKKNVAAPDADGPPHPDLADGDEGGSAGPGVEVFSSEEGVQFDGAVVHVGQGQQGESIGEEASPNGRGNGRIPWAEWESSTPERMPEPTPKAIAAAKRLIDTVEAKDIVPGHHFYGMIKRVTTDELRDPKVLAVFLRRFLPELIDKVLEPGFHINWSFTPKLLDRWTELSRERFPQSTVTSDTPTEEEKGAVYGKWICRPVSWWRKYLCSVLKDDGASADAKKFAKKTLPILKGKAGKRYYTAPYFGETSMQTFQQRMDQNYPAVMHEFEVTHKLQIGFVNPCDTLQSETFESFIAGLCQTATNANYGTSLQLMFRDGSAFNKIACGERAWNDSNGGRALCVFLAKFYKSHGHESALLSAVSTTGAKDFVLQWREEIVDQFGLVDIQKLTIAQLAKFWGEFIGRIRTEAKRLKQLGREHEWTDTQRKLMEGSSRGGTNAMAAEGEVNGKKVKAVRMGTAGGTECQTRNRDAQEAVDRDDADDDQRKRAKEWKDGCSRGGTAGGTESQKNSRAAVAAAVMSIATSRGCGHDDKSSNEVRLSAAITLNSGAKKMAEQNITIANKFDLASAKRVVSDTDDLVAASTNRGQTDRARELAAKAMASWSTGPTPPVPAQIAYREEIGSSEPEVSFEPLGGEPLGGGLPTLPPSIICLMQATQTVEQCCAAAEEEDPVCTMLTCLDPADYSLSEDCTCGMIERACEGVVVFDTMVEGIKDTCAQVDVCCNDGIGREQTLVPFAGTTFSYRIGDKPGQIFATASATVQDLKANVGSDAVWLQENEDDFGDSLDDATILHDIPDLESKILNVVVSDALWDRPGDATQVEVLVGDRTYQNGPFNECLSGAIEAGEITPPNFTALLASVSGPTDTTATTATTVPSGDATTEATEAAPPPTPPPSSASIYGVERWVYVAGSALAMAIV
ncbi:hypothetical protein ACHAXT_004172 [Thalassiosira profunda]